MTQLPAPSLSSLTLSDIRSNLVTAVSNLSISTSGAWLPDKNSYLTGGSKGIVCDCNKNIANFDDVAAFIGASAFTHCADAWSYIGRAADALLHGDVHASVHLTYYGELRAAKSLLAAEGIFVGNRYSCVLDTNSTLTKVNSKPTHQAVWDLFNDWLKQPSSVDRVAGIIEPGGQTLKNWVAAIPGGVPAVIQDMLTSLAFDLQSFAEDRERRNLASYEPTTLIPSALNVDVIRRTLTGLWDDIEPMMGGDFPSIDSAILANVLRRQYTAQNEDGDASTTQPKVDWTRWKSWVDSLIPAALNPSALRDALRSDPESDKFQSLLIAGFSNTSTASDPAEFIQPMLSRATVLARLAAGLCLRVLKDAGKRPSDLVTWSQLFAVSRGHMPDEPLPMPATDLFSDLDPPCEVLEYSRAASLGELHRDLANSAVLLGQADRVIAWTFA